ncbi:MAG: cadherin domain-containing protein [Bacteroidota bacterium]
MKKILVLSAVLICNVLLADDCFDTTYNDPVIIEITDTTLSSVYYHQNSFAEPTKLVFTNLTSVNGSVYFHQNTNLVEVDFPLLETTTSHFYFHQNTDLEVINAPNLNSVGNYVYVNGNSSLQQLNICSLAEILGNDPYYYFANNNSAIDAGPPCFSQGPPQNLNLDNTSIEENQPSGSLVGTLSADTNNPNGSLTFYLEDFVEDNNKFTIVGNQLLSNQSFDFETANEFTVEIGVRNQFGEETESQFTITIEDVINENLAIIEITDVTLDNISYHQNSFTEPTKLVFTNLTSVNGSVYFHQNPNLVEVDFPLLETTASHFYFHENEALEIINAPNLNSVGNYVYVNGNSSLQQLNICNLTEILGDDPYYYFANNNSAIDAGPPCFSQGPPENLTLDNTSISENQNINSLIGTFSADSNYPSGTLTYYLTMDGEDNESFNIQGNQLLTNTPLDFECGNQYAITVAVINQLGEQLEGEFTISILDIVDETVTVIEIDDTTLDNVYYHQDQSFISPTKLVFTNLTSVNGYVYFHENINLVEIDFPVLESTGSYFYLNNNPSLEIVNASNLNTVYDYLYVSQNAKLEALNICSLEQILPASDDDDEEPYYFIRNNDNLDFDTTCLVYTNVEFNPVDNITILPAPNTLIGSFTSDAEPGADIRYYFVDENGSEILSDDFIIVDNNLYLARPYDEYTEINFTLDVNAIRTINLNTTRNFNRNSQLKEKIELTISFSIETATLGLNDSVINDDAIQLYPNPAKNAFQINSETHVIVQSIVDVSGKTMTVSNLDEKTYNISQLSKGVYFITIENAETGDLYIKKLIIR